jgi:hypothetical protein
MKTKYQTGGLFIRGKNRSHGSAAGIDIGPFTYEIMQYKKKAILKHLLQWACKNSK